VLQSPHPPREESAMATCIRIATFACLLLAGTALAQSGKVYQWKDAKGVTHYSDAPPPKGQFETLQVAGDAGPVPAASPATAATPAVPLPAPAPVSKGEQVAMANCATARSNLERLKAGGDIGLDRDGDGKPDAPLGAEDVAKQTELAQGNINRYCGSATAP
jgi:hypothetical protein